MAWSCSGESAGREVATVVGFDVEEVLRRLATGELGPCGGGRFRIDRHGTWSFEGSPIRRPELVRLFARALHRAPDGRHWLITPHERLPVEVEDTPFRAVAVHRACVGDGDPVIRFRTDVEEEVVLSPAHPLRLEPDGRGGVRPALVVRRGLLARLLRPVYYQLAEWAEPDEKGRYGVRSAGAFFPLEPETA